MEVPLKDEFQFADFSFGVFPGAFVDDAQRPLEDIRLVVVDTERQEITHDKFINVVNYFNEQDLIVWNNTGISRSRLLGKAQSGEEIDVCFLLKNDDLWDVIVLSDTKPPEQGKLELSEGRITGQFVEKTLEFESPYWIREDYYDGYRGVIRIDQSEEELRAVLQDHGKYMHPWYTNINALSGEQLNPVVTTKTGGVLLSEPARRFTKEMVADLKRRNIESMFVSLAISFSWRVYEAETRLETYKMNPEEFEIGPEAVQTLENSLRNNKKVVCIGTSCVRVLESLPVPPKPMSGRTDIFIQPGFQFKYCDALLTNLHNSMGTHVIMACAIGGRDLILDAYRQCVERNYTFGIHGDSMLIRGNYAKVDGPN